MLRLTLIAALLSALLMAEPVQAAQSTPSLPTLDHSACAGAKLASALVPVPIVRSCDKDQDGRNDCAGKNPYQCSLACLGLTGIDLDANMRMPVDQGDGTCARTNLQDALIWKGEVALGNDRPGESYMDPRKPLPGGVLLFGAYHARQFLVNTRIDYCDSALGDLTRCAQERDALQTKVAELQAHTPTGTVATNTVSQAEYALMVAAHAGEFARIEAAKQCKLQGRRFSFGGNGNDDRCESAKSAGLVQSQWWPAAVATIFALLFGAMLWKWWQDREQTAQAKDDLRVLRLSMRELLVRSERLVNRLKLVAQELGASVESNLAELVRKLKETHDGQATEMRRMRQTLQFPNPGIAPESVARDRMDELAALRSELVVLHDEHHATEDTLSAARAECMAQAARITELTEQGNAERAALLATQVGELEAERGRSKSLTHQLRDKSREVEALQAELDSLRAHGAEEAPSFPRAPTPLPPLDLTDALRKAEEEACRLRGEVDYLRASNFSGAMDKLRETLDEVRRALDGNIVTIERFVTRKKGKDHADALEAIRRIRDATTRLTVAA